MNFMEKLCGQKKTLTSPTAPKRLIDSITFSKTRNYWQCLAKIVYQTPFSILLFFGTFLLRILNETNNEFGNWTSGHGSFTSETLGKHSVKLPICSLYGNYCVSAHHDVLPVGQIALRPVTVRTLPHLTVQPESCARTDRAPELAHVDNVYATSKHFPLVKLVSFRLFGGIQTDLFKRMQSNFDYLSG